MDSSQISEALRQERDRHSDLRAKLVIAQTEIERARQTQAKISHTAFTSDDPKAMKKLESAEQVLAGSEVRVKSIEAAISESEKRQDRLKTEYDVTANEERFHAEVVERFKRELANAEEIDKHFAGKGVHAQPLTALLHTHLDELQKISRFFPTFNISTPPVPPVTVFGRWFAAQMHGAPGFTADRFTRDRYAGSYVDALKREYDRTLAQREQSKPKLAVNE